MTERPEAIQRRLAGLDDIGQVVGALRAIASGNATRARDAVAAIRSYSDTVDAALARVAAALPAPDQGRARGPGIVLVIGAAQGFSGAYPARIAAAAHQAQAGGGALVVLGARTLAMLNAPARAAVIHSDALPGHVAQVPLLASAVADALADLAPAHPGALTLVSGRDRPGQPVETRRLWPPAPGPAPVAGPAPLTTLPPAELATLLRDEALFARLTLALMESWRAENQARFEAMARAQSNLRDKRQAVRQEYQQARQDQMTTELIELAAGSDALA